VRSAAETAARALHAVGVTVTFAPVADVPSVRRAALAGRSFSRDPFPGLGGAPSNTDDAIVTIRRSRAVLEAVDLPPFAAAIDAGAPLVMVGHARYPAFDRFRVASQSRPIMEGVLREELGFRGVVVTDSLEAEASLATGGITSVAERSLRAGADLLLLTGRGSYRPVYGHMLAAARSSPELRGRIREAAARVLALKARGALPPR
jgi:beta-N-acetylhexosaminidase